MHDRSVVRTVPFPPRRDPLLRVSLVALVALGFLAAAVAPGQLSAPLRRVANYAADGPDPIWDTAVDGRSLRAGGRLLPDDATYFIHHSRVDAQLAHDLQGGTLLFFTPALPMRSVHDADWVLSYQAKHLLPPGVRAGRTYRIGDRIYLVQVQRT